jgi:hypothetical protein
MLDKALAAISIACLIAFVSVLIRYIGELDLTIITLVVVLMAAVDFFFLTTRSKNDGERSSEQ